jgi:hypothetical protein
MEVRGGTINPYEPSDHPHSPGAITENNARIALVGKKTAKETLL